MTELTQLTETRKNFLNLVNSLTNDHLNHIPKGFNNNIIWNFGHSIITQQLLCYNLSGNRMYVDKELVHKYRIGTKPEGQVSSDEIEMLKKLGLELPKKMEVDLKTEMFKDYKEYTTSYNVTLTNIEDAIKFNNIHEGLHLGYAMAIKRIV
ncbi:MAG: DinB family protein [Flavobacteriales bacterium]